VTAQRTGRGLLAAAVVVVVAGCGHGALTGAGSGGGWTAYQLYTHCGIRNANINGRWYDAVPQQSDGQGNPPRGWGNPYQDGQVRVLTPTTVQYRDGSDHQVRFVLRPASAGSVQPCS